MRQRGGGGEEISLLRQIKFAEGLLFRVAVRREKDLQGKPAILRTRQHFHALPQQIQGQLQSSFLQMRQRPWLRSLHLFPVGRQGTQRVHPFTEPHQAWLLCTKTSTTTNTNTHQIQEEEEDEVGVSSSRQADPQHHITAR